jgi:hypothetical protein
MLCYFVIILQICGSLQFLWELCWRKFNFGNSFASWILASRSAIDTRHPLGSNVSIHSHSITVIFGLSRNPFSFYVARRAIYRSATRHGLPFDYHQRRLSQTSIIRSCSKQWISRKPKRKILWILSYSVIILRIRLHWFREARKAITHHDDGGFDTSQINSQSMVLLFGLRQFCYGHIDYVGVSEAVSLAAIYWYSPVP